jgi:hypothetical protein
VAVGERAFLRRPFFCTAAAAARAALLVLPPSAAVSVVVNLSNRVRAAAGCYGVTPGTIGTLGTLSPFVVSVVPDGNDTILTVSAAGLTQGPLGIKAGDRRTRSTSRFRSDEPPALDRASRSVDAWSGEC